MPRRDNIKKVMIIGSGTLEHFYEAVVQGGADILLAASVFHYRILSIRQVKEYLRSKGLKVSL